MPRPLLLLLPSLLLGAACGGAPEPRVRVVLVTLDTLRLDGLHAPAGEPSPMPLLAARAARGRVFERHYSATTSTQPSHASMLTGLHPWEHGVTRNALVLGPEHETVAERLRAAGWATAAVVASFPLHRRFGLDQGFASYDDDFDLGAPDEWLGVELGGSRFYSLAPAVTDRALAALDALEGERQLLWVHYYDPHSPYGDAAGERVLTTRHLSETARAGSEALPDALAAARELYDRDLAVLDRELERLLARLDADAVETHVLLVSDHGESFGEGGHLGHGKAIPDEQIHVPLVVLSPRVPAGARPEPTGSFDVGATLLALAGHDPRLGHGRDLGAATLPPTRVLGMRRTFAEPHTDVRTDGREVVLEGQRFYAVQDEGPFELLVRGNATELAPPDLSPETAAALRALFSDLEQAVEATTATEHLDPATREAMRGLGYTR